VCKAENFFELEECRALIASSNAPVASLADMPAGTNQADEHDRLAERIPVGGDVIAAKGPAEQRKPARLNLPGHADREKPPLLMAPHCPNCSNNSPFSSWKQFQLALSVLDWI
jgi:hypothetical protein